MRSIADCIRANNFENTLRFFSAEFAAYIEQRVQITLGEASWRLLINL